MSTDDLQKQQLDTDVDISQLATLDEQKEVCERMIDGISYEESRLDNRMFSIQTINNAVQSDEKMVTNLSEYLGYHFGRMEASKGLCDNARINLKKFLEGNLDDIDHGARGMYISLWYNIGISSIDEIDECLRDLEKLEGDIVEVALKEGKDLSIQETLH